MYKTVPNERCLHDTPQPDSVLIILSKIQQSEVSTLEPDQFDTEHWSNVVSVTSELR